VVLACCALLVAASATAAGGDSTTTTTATPTPTTPRGRVRLIAPGGLRAIIKRERASRSKSKATTTTTPATTTTLPVAPFEVAHTSQTFVDATRHSPARGGTPSQSSRTIVTTIYYPTTTPPSDQNPTPPPAAGMYPLLVFAHGYEIDAAAYAPLLRDLARGGYVVAAPDFPGTSTAYPGGANRDDTLQQPGDISFVITSMLQLSASPGLFQGSIDPNAVGDAGQSDGGVTALAAAYNTCCIDPRIKASSILTGATIMFEGEWFPPGTPPLLLVHATADEVNGYSASTSMFSRAQSPKYLLTIDGGSHFEVYVEPPWEPEVAHAMVAFFDLYLKGDQAASAELHAVGSQPGYSLQQG
jgi:predicted dienelactone hydrolase